MTRGELAAWLEARQPAPPAALLGRLRDTCTNADADLPDHLAAHGRTLLQRVVAPAADGAGRSLALDLLAADAFVTYAFEAQAERDVGGLAGLADRVTRPTEGNS